METSCPTMLLCLWSQKPWTNPCHADDVMLYAKVCEELPYTSRSRTSRGRTFQREIKTYKPKKDFARRMCAGPSTSAMRKPNFFVCTHLQPSHLVVLFWWWHVVFPCCVNGGDVMWCDVMWCDVMWCDVMWRDVMWCDVMWCIVTMSCDVIWFMTCDLMVSVVMWYNGMGWDVMRLWCDVVGCEVMWCMMWWIGRWCAANYGEIMSQQNPWNLDSNTRCNPQRQKTIRLRRAHVTVLWRSTKY